MIKTFEKANIPLQKVPTPIIETGIGETITTVGEDKSRLRHIAVKDTNLRYACDYCSMRDLDCSVIMCGKDERSDNNNIHYELIKQ